jgi:hypothetical protein
MMTNAYPLLAELHLLEYQQQMLEYLTAFGGRRPNMFQPLALQKFSGWDNPDGYDDDSMTHEMITDIYLEFVKKTRERESSLYCKTRTGQCKQIPLMSKLNLT